MKCTNCGTELAEGAKFCRICGQEVGDFSEPEKPEKSKAKRVIVTLIIIVLVLAAAAVGAFFYLNKTPSLKAGKAFKTERDAYTYFIDNLAKGDYVNATDAFGPARKAEEYDMGAFLDRTMSWNLAMPMLAPSDSEANIAYNEASYRQLCLSNIKLFVLGFLSDEELILNDGMPINLSDNPDARKELLSINASVVEGLSVLDVEEIDSYSPSYHSEAAVATSRKQAEIYGGRAYREYVSLLKDADGNKYLGTFSVLEYDDGFYLMSLNSNYLGVPSYGNVIPLGDISVDSLGEIDVAMEFEGAF